MSGFNSEDLISVKRLSDYAVLPVRGSEWAAGFDLSAAHECVVPAHGKALVQTDLSIAIPMHTYARIAPRSGLAWKHFIDVGAGVIDYDYRGAVGVVLFNHSSVDFPVKRGDRIAQLILEKISMAGVAEVAELSETSRGAGGFGSTGVSSNVEASCSQVLSPSKKMKTEPDDAARLASVLLFLETMKSLIGEERRQQLKSGVLTDDILLYKVYSVMLVYQKDGAESSFIESVDCLLKTYSA